MPLNIKNKVTERLARQMARETGESLTGAVHKSLQERWDGLMQQRNRYMQKIQIDELLRRVDALPDLDSRPEGEILGYGQTRS